MNILFKSLLVTFLKKVTADHKKLLLLKFYILSKGVALQLASWVVALAKLLVVVLLYNYNDNI